MLNVRQCLGLMIFENPDGLWKSPKETFFLFAYRFFSPIKELGTGWGGVLGPINKIGFKQFKETLPEENHSVNPSLFFCAMITRKGKKIVCLEYISEQVL